MSLSSDKLNNAQQQFTCGKRMLIRRDETVLVTGASGFIGRSVVRSLLGQGFQNLRLLARTSPGCAIIEEIVRKYRKDAQIEVSQGDLLSPEDCTAAAKNVAVVYHLA